MTTTHDLVTTNVQHIMNIMRQNISKININIDKRKIKILHLSYIYFKQHLINHQHLDIMVRQKLKI